MLYPSRFLISALALAVGVANTASAQRGRGPSEAILSRSGSYLVDVKLPKPDAEQNGKIPLGACSLVESAVEDGHLTFLYLYDPNKNVTKHAQFEQTVFGHAEIRTVLRCFQCGRVNLAKDPAALAEFGERAPMFVAFNAKGQCAGEVSMGHYKVTATPIIKLLERAARKHAKLRLPKFVKQYRKFLNDYQVYEGRKRTLEQKRRRLEQKSSPQASKLADVDKQEQTLEKGKGKLLLLEKKLLRKARVPPRDPKAKRLGDRQRRGR